MWTRTLSTTISTSPSGMAGLSHARRSQRPGSPAPDDGPDHQADDESADMGEEGDTPLGVRRSQRGDSVDQLEDEPEAQDDEGRHLDELVEEAEEDERQDSGPGKQHAVRAACRSARARRANQRD